MSEAVVRSYKCDRKREFNSITSAVNFLKHARKQGIIVSDTLEIYECEFCGKYHLGHRKDKK